jgi:hypothetical protein
MNTYLLVCYSKLIFVEYDQVKGDQMGKAYSTNGSEDECIRILVGRPEGKRPLGRPRSKWIKNIVTDLNNTLLGNILANTFV